MKKDLVTIVQSKSKTPITHNHDIKSYFPMKKDLATFVGKVMN